MTYEKPKMPEGYEDIFPEAGKEISPSILSKDLLEQEYAQKPSIIENLIDEDTLTLIVAPPKTGKSMVCLHLACHISVGVSFCDWNIVNEHKVLYVDFETRPSQLQKRLKSIIASPPHFFDLEELTDEGEIGNSGLDRIRTNLRFKSGREALSNDEEILETDAFLKWLEKDIVNNEIKVAIIDPIYFLIDGSESSNEVWMPLLKKLNRIIARTNCAILVVHHTKKGADYETDDIDSGAGSGVLTRIIDQKIILTLHQEPEHVILKASVLRDGVPLPSMVLKRNYGCFACATDMIPLPRSKAFKKREATKLEDGAWSNGLLNEIRARLETEVEVRVSALKTFLMRTHAIGKERASRVFEIVRPLIIENGYEIRKSKNHLEVVHLSVAPEKRSGQ